MKKEKGQHPLKARIFQYLQFTPLPEMGTSFLQANLSAKALALAQQLSVTDAGSFKEATAKVDELIKNEIATASSVDSEDQSVTGAKQYGVSGKQVNTTDERTVFFLHPGAGTWYGHVFHLLHH